MSSEPHLLPPYCHSSGMAPSSHPFTITSLAAAFLSPEGWPNSLTPRLRTEGSAELPGHTLQMLFSPHSIPSEGEPRMMLSVRTKASASLGILEQGLGRSYPGFWDSSPGSSRGVGAALLCGNSNPGSASEELPQFLP